MNIPLWPFGISAIPRYITRKMRACGNPAESSPIPMAQKLVPVKPVEHPANSQHAVVIRDTMFSLQDLVQWRRQKRDQVERIR